MSVMDFFRAFMLYAILFPLGTGGLVLLLREVYGDPRKKAQREHENERRRKH